jgi:putative hydrolase of the HAD superfamily
MTLPKLILLDAVGTLFGVKGSVGAVYADLARQHGVMTDPIALDAAFRQSFKQSPPMAFPGADPTEVPLKEYRWWYDIARSTFKRMGVAAQFEDFDGFFSELYEYFATADPWQVYADTQASLDSWRTKGITLGVLSNFDSRIYRVLDALALADYFDSVTISTEVGAAKPDSLMFIAALEKHDCELADAWHVGDSYEQDYQGAIAAGLKGVWLKRPEQT